MAANMSALIDRAKGGLGVDRLVLAIHDASFPSSPDEDVGRGTPYGAGGEALLRFARELGFDAIQLGPQGLGSPHNPSPYDGALFARDPVALSIEGLVAEGWIDRPILADQDPARADHAAAHATMRRLLDDAWHRFLDRGERASLARYLADNEGWLVPAALYDVLVVRHGHGHFAHFGADRTLWSDPRRGLDRRALREHFAAEVERFAFEQRLVARQHRAFLARAEALGLAVHGDFQVGLAPRDEWAFGAAFLPGYRLGAPPSRTNPEGQPWGYPVLHPGQRAPGEPAHELLCERFRRAFDDYHALRIDHPHGLVCPWVYRANDPDPARAVRQGARLFASPDLRDHPVLAAWAIVRPSQLRRELPRHHDDWVGELDEDQVERYALWLDLATQIAARHGRTAEALVCEILSTEPRPLAEVARRHGLGRFRVTQKADLTDCRDVYRAENARPEDWVMIGTHDTPTIWSLFEGWSEGRRQAEARHLAAALGDPSAAPRWAKSPGDLARAKLAELFACRARHVMIFFADLFGFRERYNEPGTVGPQNWRLRLAPDFAARYRRDRALGLALDLAGALSLALRARGHEDLADDLAGDA
jgi:4-alpha-glucanotransferase